MHTMGEGTERLSVARRLWSPPARFADRPTERRVTFLELFFDLVFVVVIHSSDGTSRAIRHGRASDSSCSSFTRSGCRRSTGRRPRTVADADPVVSAMAAVGAGSAGCRRPDQIDPIVTADTILTVSPEGMAAEPGSVDGLPVVYEFDPGASS
jgi:hypothetical protein